MSLFDLEGRNALVTGAGSGIGQRLAVGLAEYGANVTILDLAGQRQGSDTTAEQVKAIGREALVVDADVTDPVSVREAIGHHVSRFGRLDIAVNCAGVNHSCSAEDLAPSDWKRVLDVNLSGVFYCCQSEASSMFSSGGGSIINVASMSATIVNRGLLQAHYNASKAGVKHLTSTLAMEWVTRKVRVNSLSPGYIMTPMISGPDWAEKIRGFEEQTPMHRLGTPDDLVGPVIFLASAASAYMTGTDLLVEGGFTSW
ncbi:SDR family oxidoreductase [Conexibacter sp. S30A1]|jgi:NAD(P)-dependent dehydrogenase (short-subunit alcohol dehydrogenase family)|uniref:SDR family oxidoreductase n=1 Tax=Conexibacter sp. S30A1 TaxID=2937800 RepID=UPI00200E22CF|nr:SDR family oxidoreductase [Conexibacter sp. S30A1]